ncbi:glutamate--cysteine ligase [Streptomyces lunalinharesii]|uniref:Putative glutamate--cysteine ligase 2 n=1 Tax=Streptomyces lunalinharesii TaxID=333384 RepID=A0ABN3RFP7_9ACTN
MSSATVMTVTSHPLDAPCGEGHVARAPRGDSPSASGPITVGVEEELLLVDPETRDLCPLGPEVVRRAARELAGRVSTETTRYQVEIRTDPHTCLVDASEQLRATRSAVARAAADHGLRLISTGSPVLPQPSPLQVTPGDRYAHTIATYRFMGNEATICACHIHIGIPDPDEAVGVSNHLRPWLPTLSALAANSPYWAGQDTGYASWRAMICGRLPVAGPPPYFESSAHFEELVQGLIAVGAVTDRAGLFWDVRPSHHVPTLEVRVCDALLVPEDTILLTAVVRALAATALHAVRSGVPAPRPAAEMLRAAGWRAARDGLAGEGVDLATGRLVPQTELVHRLLTLIAPALRHHRDLDLVRTQWTRLLAEGNGSDRQRAAFARRSSLHGVVDHLISSTCPA